MNKGLHLLAHTGHLPLTGEARPNCTGSIYYNTNTEGGTRMRYFFSELTSA